MLVDLGRNDLGRVARAGQRAGADLHGGRALQPRHAPGLQRRGRAGDGQGRARRPARLLPGRHRLGRAEDPGDGDHRRPRARGARPLRRRRRLPLLLGRPRHLHRHPHPGRPRGARPRSPPAPASSPTPTRPPRSGRPRTRRRRCSPRWRSPKSWRDGHDPDDRQLRLVHLQPRAGARRRRRRGRGGAQRRRERRRRCWRAAPRGSCSRPAPAARRTPGSASSCCASAPQVPLLGVCLGHQALGVAFGATVDRAPRLMHGKTSPVRHEDRRDLRRPAQSVRGHPLPQPGGQGGDPPGGARAARLGRRRHADGDAPPRAPLLGRAVPPRVGA